MNIPPRNIGLQVPFNKSATPQTTDLQGLKKAPRLGAFTLIEIMVAIGVLGGLMVAIFASWQAIVQSSQIGITAAVEAHRNRVSKSPILRISDGHH
jgi:prepilin-type N-terminal cleavage/methylation domain-containing protein